MRLPHKAHLAVVDGNKFVLMQNEGTPDSPSLKEVAKPELTASNFSAGVRHQDDVGRKLGRTDLDELAHAAAASEWLNAAVLDGTIEKLAVTADPKTLGEMRRHYHTKLQQALIAEEAKTLTGEPISRIEKVLLSE
ncbi:baeRF12 domain-containing protein [Croceicoccus naphthovorans]|uniref:Attachment protein n=1 Tax=Croceicoccus naphthovorans TaxID=1348774 RepID=A0A0G3XIJ3_9SPHN|nr:host attachment protein [Croceicoccus naphthovorans]AKM11017.1 attachment protein [Croceicoccus naphthovorans]MBB3989562.1 protein required for attachment to host cells [Croceicoccus naphthovorans]